MSRNPAEEPETHIIRLSDDEIGHLKSVILRGLDDAYKIHEYDLVTQMQILLERVERA